MSETVNRIFLLLGLIYSSNAFNLFNSGSFRPHEIVEFPEDPACKSDEIQKVVFCRFANYTGDSHSFCSNKAQLQELPDFPENSKSVCVHRGVWMIGASFGGLSDEAILVNGNFGKLCFAFSENLGVRYKSVRHLASNNLTKSVLSLYERMRYSGAELLLEGNEVRLPAPLRITSFALTGNQGLTIFSKTDFKGEFECISPGRNDPSRLGVSFLNEIELKEVGSVRKGCESNSGAELIPNSGRVIEASNEILNQIRFQIFKT